MLIYIQKKNLILYSFSWYGKTIHKSSKGEWDFDLTKKPIDKIRIHGSSFAAIRTAQQSLLKQGFSIKNPILFMCSSRSIKPDRTWRDDYENGKNKKKIFIINFYLHFYLADLILNVTTMRRVASTLGQQITLYEIENGKHDIFLSEVSVREKAFHLMFRWLTHLEEDNWMIPIRT